MISPETLLTGLVGRLNAIAALVALCPAGITAYVDEYPNPVDLMKAIREMPQGSILAAHQETGPGQLNRRETWRHRVSLYIRPAGKVSDAWFLIVTGVPTGGDGLKMLYTGAVHSALHRMNIPTIRRQFLAIDQFTTLDYFEVEITFDEKGD